VSTLRLAAASPSSSHPSLISWAPSLDPLATSCSGATGRGAERLGEDWGSSKGRRQIAVLLGGFLGGLQIGSTDFTPKLPRG
jgi:hypothetical protein